MARPGAALLGIAGVALLGVGFGVGVLVSGGGAPKIEYVDRPATTAAPAAAPAPAAEKPASDAPAKPAEPASPLSASDRDALRALLARIPDREIATGSGTVTGRVKSEDGRPLEGAEISLQPEWQNPKPAVVPPPSPPPEPDPVDLAISSVQGTRWWRNSKRTATTDAAGEFRFDGLADTKHRVSAKLKGWQIQPKDWNVANAAKPGAVVEFLASPSVEVRVEITVADGTVPDNVTLMFKSERNSMGMGVNLQNPVLQVKPGEYEATATAGSQREWSSDPQQVTIATEGEPPVLRFTLRGKPGIRGRLIFPEGEEAEGAVGVYVLRLPGDRKPDPAALKAGGTSTWVQGQHQGFRFQFPDLAPGRYALGASRTQNGPVVVVEEVEVGEGSVVRDLRMPSPDRAEYVVLRVLGPDGNAVTDFQVSTGYRSGQSSSSGGNTAVNRPDGTRWVFHQPLGGLAESEDGVYWVAVTSGKYGSLRGEYRKGGAQELTLRFEPAGRVEARVSGAEGSGFEGRLAFGLAPATERNQSTYFSGPSDTRIGPSGIQIFPSVQPGECVLTLFLKSEHSMLPIARTQVTVKSGKNDFTVPMPALHSISVTGAESWAMVRKTDESGFTLQRTVGAEGRVDFEGLPEGEYEIRSGRKTQTFRVPGTTEVKL